MKHAVGEVLSAQRRFRRRTGTKTIPFVWKLWSTDAGFLALA
jgi:hypothetical protein